MWLNAPEPQTTTTEKKNHSNIHKVYLMFYMCESAILTLITTKCFRFFLSIQVHLVYTMDKEGWIENKDGLWNNETFGRKPVGCKIWFQGDRVGQWICFEKEREKKNKKLGPGPKKGYGHYLCR